jgi:hypothetical protein
MANGFRQAETLPCVTRNRSSRGPGHDVVHVRDAPLVEVRRLVHVMDLPVEVARGDEAFRRSCNRSDRPTVSPQMIFTVVNDLIEASRALVSTNEQTTYEHKDTTLKLD